MGLYMELMWPFMGWMAIVTIVMVVAFVVINKVGMYNGPEDEEVWEPDKEHFILFVDSIEKE
jgi:hypothetical protein